MQQCEQTSKQANEQTNTMQASLSHKQNTLAINTYLANAKRLGVGANRLDVRNRIGELRRRRPKDGRVRQLDRAVAHRVLQLDWSGFEFGF